MLLTIAIVVVVLIAVLLAIGATKPKTFRIQRSTSVQAPPERIVPLISDFHRWPMWSPYEKYDPAMQRTFSGAEAGKGAVYEWSGNSKAGKGRMEIIGLAPASKVTIKLDFIKPFEGHNVVDFTLEPSGGSTKVSWIMNGPAAFPMRVMSIFLSLDTMIGKDFEAGLENLKSVAENQPALAL